MRGVSVDVGLQRLAGYAREHGHANPRTRTVWLGWAIGVWLREVRKKKRRGKLTLEQIDAAESLGVDWDPPKGRRPTSEVLRPSRKQSREARLHSSLDRLVPYWQTHGNIDVLQLTGTADWPQAGRFVCRLRTLRREGTLPDSVEKRATEMGIVWDPPIGRRRRPGI